MKKVIVFLIFSFHLGAMAQAPEGSTLSPEEAREIVDVVAGQERARWERPWFVYVEYSPMDFLLPGKKGILVGRHSDSKNSWEIEYLQGSISLPGPLEKLGAVKEDRLSLLWRYYFGDYFNLLYGVHFNRFESSIGNDLAARLYPAAAKRDILTMESWGPTIGLGHRWTFSERWSFGVDWVTWAQPAYVSKEVSAFINNADPSKEKDDLDSAFKVVKYFPRFSVVKLQIGVFF